MKILLVAIGLGLLIGLCSLPWWYTSRALQRTEPEANQPTPPPPPPPRTEPPHTWRFSRDSKIRFTSGGATSVREGGNLEASYVRREDTNVVVKLIDGGNGIISLMDLSDDDLDYLAALDGVEIDEGVLSTSVEARKNRLAQQSAAVAGAIESERARHGQAHQQLAARQKSEEAVAKKKRDEEFWYEINKWKRAQRPNWRR